MRAQCLGTREKIGVNNNNSLLLHTCGGGEWCVEYVFYKLMAEGVGQQATQQQHHIGVQHYSYTSVYQSSAEDILRIAVSY